MFVSIKKRLTLSFILASIVPLFLFSTVLLYAEYTVQKKQTFLIQKEEAIRISQDIKVYFEGLEKDIEFLFKITSFVASKKSKKENYLSKMISKENQFERLTLTDKQGKELFYSDRITPYKETKKAKYINKELIDRALKDKQNYYGNIYFSKKNFEPLIDAAFLVKNLKTLEVDNILIAKMRFKKVWKILSSLDYLDGEEIFVTNSDNMIVAHKNPSIVINKTLITKPKENGFLLNRNNEYVLRSSNSFELNGTTFHVIVQRNIFDALSLSFYTFIYANILFLFLLVFIAFVIKHIDKSIIKPILNLSNVAENISKGDLTHRADIFGNDELSFLATTFNDMSDKIGETMHNLKDEIELKTAIQKNLENSEKILLAIVNNANSIIYLKDLDSNYQIVNDGFLKLHNITKEDVLNKNTSSIFGKKDLAYIIEKENYVKKTQKSIASEDYLLLDDGEEKFFLSTRFPIFDKDGNIINIAGVSTDISDIKKIQRKLENFNKTLESTIAEKTKDLTHTNKELEDTVQRLNETQEHLVFSEKIASLGRLVAGVAHEINTPLGIVLTGLTHFEKMTIKINELYKQDNMSQNEFEEYIKTSQLISEQALKSINRATALVQTFKQVSVNATEEEKRKINIKEYTHSLIITAQKQTKKTNINIVNNIPDNIFLETYPGAYGQVITKLITNSFTHAYPMDEKGTITLELKKEEEYYRLIYIDDGKGIEEDDLPYIFEPFFTTSRKVGHTGLGLNILYNIVRQQLQGEVTCTSKLNKGVCFEILIPIDLN